MLPSVPGNGPSMQRLSRRWSSCAALASPASWRPSSPRRSRISRSRSITCRLPCCTRRRMLRRPISRSRTLNGNAACWPNPRRIRLPSLQHFGSAPRRSRKKSRSCAKRRHGCRKKLSGIKTSKIDWRTHLFGNELLENGKLI